MEFHNTSEHGGDSFFLSLFEASRKSAPCLAGRLFQRPVIRNAGRLWRLPDEAPRGEVERMRRCFLNASGCGCANPPGPATISGREFHESTLAPAFVVLKHCTFGSISE